jgi:hypothetical protein
MNPYTVEIRELGDKIKKECMEYGYTEQVAGELAQIALKTAHEKKLERTVKRYLSQPKGGSRRSTRRKRKGTRRH